MSHELEIIAQQESAIVKKIVEYKMKIIRFLEDTELKSLNCISINRRNGYLKIETRSPMPEPEVSKMESYFHIVLDHQSSIGVDDKELYNYIFKPQ